MGEAEVRGFLTHLATERHVAASTQNQALNALLFLYQKVLRQELALGEFERARRSQAGAGSAHAGGSAPGIGGIGATGRSSLDGGVAPLRCKAAGGRSCFEL